MIALVAAMLALGFFAPAIFAGQVPIFRDFVNVFLPFRLYSAHALASGRLPLWAPEPSFGAPFLGNYQSAVLYPPSLIIDAIPGPCGIGSFLAIHYWIAGIGTDALLRRRGLPIRARLFGTCSMMLGGTMISAASYDHLSVAAWIPFSVAAAESLVQEPAPKRFGWLVALLTLQALAGSPECFIQSASLIVAAACVAVYADRRRWPALGLIPLAGVLALGLSAAQLLPTFEYFSQTVRSKGYAATLALDQSLEPRTLLTLLLPHRLDGGILGEIRARQMPLFWSIYIGIVPLGLALLGMGTRRGRRWSLVLVGSLLLALGRHTPLYPLLYSWLPRLFGAFRYPQKFLITSHFSAVVLATIGFSWIEERARRVTGSVPRLLPGVLLIATMVDLWTVHQPAMLFSDWDSLRHSVSAKLIAQGRDARIFHYRRTAEGFERWTPKLWIGRDLRAREADLWAKLCPNVPLAYGVGFTNGADSLSFGRPPIAALHATLATLPLGAELRLLRSLGVTLLVGEDPLDDAALDTVETEGSRRLWVYRIRGAAPRIYLARRIYSAPSPGEAFRAMSEESFRSGVDAILLDAPRVDDRDQLAGGRLGPTRERPESLSVGVEAAGPAVLVVADSFFPGWHANVDGHPISMLRANGGLARAVELPAGKHSVTMLYRPASFRLGSEVSLASLIVLAVVLARMRGAPDRPADDSSAGANVAGRPSSSATATADNISIVVQRDGLAPSPSTKP